MSSRLLGRESRRSSPTGSTAGKHLDAQAIMHRGGPFELPDFGVVPLHRGHVLVGGGGREKIKVAASTAFEKGMITGADREQLTNELARSDRRDENDESDEPGAPPER